MESPLGDTRWFGSFSPENSTDYFELASPGRSPSTHLINQVNAFSPSIFSPIRKGNKTAKSRNSLDNNNSHLFIASPNKIHDISNARFNVSPNIFMMQDDFYDGRVLDSINDDIQQPSSKKRSAKRISYDSENDVTSDTIPSSSNNSSSKSSGTRKTTPPATKKDSSSSSSSSTIANSGSSSGISNNSSSSDNTGSNNNNNNIINSIITVSKKKSAPDSAFDRSLSSSLYESPSVSGNGRKTHNASLSNILKDNSRICDDSFVTTPPLASSNAGCNCKKSKCLKLYCECFASLKVCKGCNCIDCNNNDQHELIRQEAIKATKDRNIAAFKLKVTSSEGHNTGCHCKQSQCLKKYCECYQGGAFCSDNCKCQSCQNYSGSIQLIKMAQTSRSSKDIDHILLSSNCVTIGGGNGNDNYLFKKPDNNYHINDTSPLGVDEFRSPFYNNTVGVHYNNTHINTSIVSSTKHTISTTNKKVKFSSNCHPIVYPFFGSTHPQFPKVTMLKMLEYLDGKSLYAASCTNSLWCSAAMDDALWE